MYWGRKFQSNEIYEETVQVPFHVSQAVLNDTSLPDNEFVQLILQNDGVDYILCKLRNLDTVQMSLNLTFCVGDEISFRSVGGIVDLTGFYVDDDAATRCEPDSSANEEETDDNNADECYSSVNEETDDNNEDECHSSDNEETNDNDTSERHNSDNEAGTDDNDRNVQPPPTKRQRINGRQT